MKWIYFIILLAFFSCQSNTDTPTPTNDNTASQSKTATSTEVDNKTSSILFSNNLTESPELNRLNYEYFYNGGGVAIGDINNDGLADIYFTGNMVPDKLYLNEGDFNFNDITNSAGIPFENDWHTGVTMVDINADGWLDIYVCRSGWFQNRSQLTNRLYVNNKNNTFTEAAADYGLADSGYGVQASFFDGDLDGDLDVFILNNPEKKPGTNNINTYSDEIATGAYSTDRYYENQNGKFVERTDYVGLQTFGYRHGISVGDVNNDHWPDLYISGDFDDPDYLFINDGDGTFTNRINQFMDHISMFSMGNDQADINHDGFMDIFVADMTPGDHERSKQNMASMNPDKFYALTEAGFHHQYMINTLQLNNAGRSFSNISHMAGLASTDWSWATLFLDWDMDGFDDLFVTNGIKRDVLNNDVRIKATQLAQQQQNLGAMQVLNLMPSFKIDNFFYRNNGKLGFENKSSEWIGTQAFNSNGAAYGDLDNDGDLDLVINNVDDIASIIQNNNTNNYLKIKIAGGSNNPFGIGSRVKVYTEDDIQTKELFPCRGFYSSVEPVLHFGLGKNSAVSKIEITHGKGLRKVIKNPTINQTLEIDLRGSEKDEVASNPTLLFTAVEPSDLGLTYSHKENSFNDFATESLLPQRFSQNGPFLAQGDVNQDGITDLYLGGANGQAGELYIQNREGQFSKTHVTIFEQDKAHEDMESIFFDADGDNDVDLYVVSGGYEEKDGSPYYQDRLYLNDGQGNFTKSDNLPDISSSGQAVAVADIDQDGDLDIFRGGRVHAGLYPKHTSSLVMLNNGGNFKNDVRTIDIRGLVTDAVFKDINQDAFPELIVSGEWMPITYFLNEKGNYNKPVAIGKPGWFQSVLVDDIDGDEKFDILAGNMGENNKFHPSGEKPLHIYASDFDENGSNDIVLSKMHKGYKVPVRGRQCSSEQMPFIREKFPTFKQFAEASLEEVYGDKLEDAYHQVAETFSHEVFFDLAADSESQALPRQTQRSPLMQFVILQIGGTKYYVGAGNHYQTEVETSRYDAGIGVVLTYQDNQFKNISSKDTGLYLRGDIKDVEVIEQADGNQLLLATRNDSALLIYRINS